ncbi:MAG: hypothetical protein MZV64_43845 [Ignavibacteriales bacterium]|nr:hypothetical protein [Ignavibacteriales bacterium]
MTAAGSGPRPVPPVTRIQPARSSRPEARPPVAIPGRVGVNHRETRRFGGGRP